VSVAAAWLRTDRRPPAAVRTIAQTFRHLAQLFRFGKACTWRGRHRKDERKAMPSMQVSDSICEQSLLSDPNGSSIRAIILSRASDLLPYRETWSVLARNACEANIFYEPEFVLPYMEAYAQGQELRIVLIFLAPADKARGDSILIGFFPFLRVRMHWLIRVPALKGLAGGWLLHGGHGTPLVHREHAAAAFSGLFRALDHKVAGLGIADLSVVSTEGPFAEQIRSALRGRGQPHALLRVHSRPVFRRSATATNIYAMTSGGGYKAELRRQHRRLAEQGKLEVRELGPRDDLDRWLTEFLVLEASGWKGRAGVALNSSSAGKRFFLDLAQQLYAQGRLEMFSLCVNEQPIAINCLLVGADRSTAFGFKTAFAEAFAKYSPGVQLLVHILNGHVQPCSEIALLDSCATGEKLPWSLLPADRRWLGHLVIAANRPLHRLIVTALVRLIAASEWGQIFQANLAQRLPVIARRRLTRMSESSSNKQLSGLKDEQRTSPAIRTLQQVFRNLTPAASSPGKEQ
jgi:CelD/BcsL family acetyltransferase involved in cellulose biosynthesis